MSHRNIALFVPDEGCPHQCSFCNQKTISGKTKPVCGEDVKNAAETALKDCFDANDGEIAFFGGSFTGIDNNLMTELLEAAYDYVKKGFFKGIRISTRPDYINDEILIRLKNFGVTSIELGCQSMDDDVLALNNRGHVSADVVRSCALIKAHGFELGVQMMTGLFGDTDEKCLETAKKLISLSPDTVRIYPTIVLENTDLARYMKDGLYKPQTTEEAVELCARLAMLFAENNIKIIRLGLHSGGNVDSGYLAGAYHPAFAELVYSRIYLNNVLSALEKKNIKGRDIKIIVGKKYISQLLGQKKSNIEKLKSLGYNPVVVQSDDLKSFETEVFACF